MKNLTEKEFRKAPYKIQFIYCMAILETPIGSKIFEEAIKEHPEYFPDEVEHRRKWGLIPEQVHLDYQKERELLDSEIYKDMPESKGLLHNIHNYEEWSEKYNECQEKEKPLAAALHKKYYGKYGIEWNGW